MSKLKKLSLQEAVMLVRQFFFEQCGKFRLARWSVLNAWEDAMAGTYVIQCEESCCGDVDRRHEVAVSIESGEIVYQRRLES